MGEGSLEGEPEVDLLEGVAVLGVVAQLGDSADVVVPVDHAAVEAFQEILVVHTIFEVALCQVLALVFALQGLALDLGVDDELDVGDVEVLLALDQVDLKLLQVLLDKL